jgi:pimeloyl-ACP methyl ester carboxylesterase
MRIAAGRMWLLAGGVAAAATIAMLVARHPAIHRVDESALRAYEGAFRWDDGGYVYLQLWNEFAGDNELVAFDESGEVRTLYPLGTDRFFAGPGAAVPSSIESRITFERHADGEIKRMTWNREDAARRRTAQPAGTERTEAVRFSNGSIALAGGLLAPAGEGRHPAVILVHGSGPGTRWSLLPFARFLVRHGIAVLGFDKRGAGESTGDWTVASFEDLASDVIAAYTYLRSRADIDSTRIGLLGVSQAGWVMPLAAAQTPELAFIVSISGAGVPAGVTTIDHARHEMMTSGLRPELVEKIVDLMRLQLDYVRGVASWDTYVDARQALTERLGGPPGDTFPASPDHPYWDVIRRLYLYDPAPTLRQLRTPVLALFGELDNNVLAEKNKAAWEEALASAGHTDATLRILPKANHIMLEAEIGNNGEMATLRRFVPEYVRTVTEWVMRRVGARDTRHRQ